MGNSAEQMMAEVLETAMRAAEAKVDKALEALENPDDDELDRLRASRLAQLKKRQADQRKWMDAGHGEYSELSSEKEFFPTVQKSKLTVVHFYRQATFRCNIVDKHLKILAQKHVETKFVKLNAEKCPFLVDRLMIKILPTILIVIDSQIVDRVVGFSELGNTDDFTTEVMEWRLGVADGIHYTGDKSVPPYERVSKKPTMISKNLRGTLKDNESDSGEEEDIPTFMQKKEAFDLSSLANHSPEDIDASLKDLLEECTLTDELGK